MIDRGLTLPQAAEKARGGSKCMILCPAHDDSSPSLSVDYKPGKGALLNCHAGCDTKDILTAVGWTWADLFDPDDNLAPNEEWTPAGNASHIYPYRDEQGNKLYEVLRVPQPGGGKTFFQRHWDEVSSKHVWNVREVRRVLYRLPEVVNAVNNGEVIYLTEGEKDADTVTRLGLCGTTNAMGAGKWDEGYTNVLAGATVVMLSDADTAGRLHTRTVRDALIEAGCRVEIREARPPHKDVTEMREHGQGIEQMLVVVPFADAERVKFGVDVLDIIVRSVTATEFVIPHVLARRERLVMTGLEGHGKSTFLRQIGTQVAAGIHPFALSPMEPKRVLYIDVENEPGQTLQSWQDLIGLAAYHGHPVERDMLTVLEEWDNSELDLATRDGSAWLHERIHAYQPDLVLMGPLTNMVGRDLKDDEPVRRLKAAVNSARTICGSAFIMEHHAPHRNPSDKRRSIRPYGSSMFLKWPDYGFGMNPTDVEGTYRWERFRWPRVRTRAWPAALRWGGPTEWPWVECEEPPE